MPSDTGTPPLARPTLATARPHSAARLIALVAGSHAVLRAQGRRHGAVAKGRVAVRAPHAEALSRIVPSIALATLNPHGCLSECSAIE